MNKSLKIVTVGICILATNAGTWFYSVKIAERPLVAASMVGREMKEVDLSCDQNDSFEPTSEEKGLKQVEDLVNEALIATAKHDSQEQNPISNPAMDLPDNRLPSDISFEMADVNTFNKESFQYDSLEHKLQTIDSLSSNGDDLVFIQSVATTDQDPEVRAAAAKRLSGVNNYAAVDTLVAALEDENPKVALTALTALKKTQDRSLIPILKSKSESLGDGVLETHFSDAIRSLEYSKGVSLDSEY